MYILTRYVVWEVLKFFVAALMVLTLMVTLGMGVKGQRDYGLPPVLMLRDHALPAAGMLGITIPVAMLSRQQRFRADDRRERIVALKSLGISPMAVVWPVLVLAAFFSLGTVWMYELAATWGRPGVSGSPASRSRRSPTACCKRPTPFDCDQFSITVKRVEGRKLIHPRSRSRPSRAGRRSPDRRRSRTADRLEGPPLRIICRQGEVDIEGANAVCRFPTSRNTPCRSPRRARYHRDWVAMSDIPELDRRAGRRTPTPSRQLRQLERLREAKRPSA